ncbi:MAG: secondary thiamine-phosphate synthase enzyme YjbQ [Desulfurococcaceae archaeon]|uniref:YjbQ family protein n=1 Tax=Staphylothermus marinus TaxID=2280 RepID=A0A7C4HEH3_STAMA
MKIHVDEITLSTKKRFELIDITSRIEDIVKKSNINNGLLLVYAPHATVSIIVNENESGLIEDIINKVKEITEPDSSKWKHNLIDDNAHAHIGSALFDSSRVFPVINGRIARGTWQNIFLFEMDGPRSSRKIYVVVIGEEK